MATSEPNAIDAGRNRADATLPARIVELLGRGRNVTALTDVSGGGWRNGQIVAADPDAIVEIWPESPNPFAGLEAAVAQEPSLIWLGYIGYDAGRHIENIGSVAADDVELPVVRFCGYRAWLEYRSGTFVGCGDTGAGRRLQREVNDAVKFAQDSGRAAPLEMSLARGLERSFSRTEYETAVSLALEGIRAGDFYQVNLAQRLSVPVSQEAMLFGSLATRHPAPFGAYIDAGAFSVLSVSPELFIRVEEGVITTRPIKGTRPRSNDAARDAALARELAASAKDRAENVMIVDLMRSDLGRVCINGSIAVPELWGIENFASVHHMVSTVTGDLGADVGLERLFRAIFPGGSITGAPKVAAMRFIERTEPVRRGAYTGAIGRIGPIAGRGAATLAPARSGLREWIPAAAIDVELNIAIRTVVICGDRAHLSVGGGIVSDSTPRAEYQETLDKAAGIAEVLGIDIDLL